MPAARLVLLLLTLLAAGCATAPKKTFTGAGVDTPFLWRATQAGQPGTVYLLGTLHIRADGEERLDRAVLDAVAAADRIAVELEPDAQDPAEMKALIDELVLMNDATVADLMQPDDVEALAAMAADCGVPGLEVAPLEPWFVSMVLAVKCGEAWGFNGKGVEHLLVRLAQRSTPPLPIVELETARGQLEAAGVLERDPAMLAAMVHDLTREDLGKLVDAYETRDVAGLMALMKESREADGSTPEHIAAMWTDRNRAMAEDALGFLGEAKTTVFAVGSGHMAGEEGVLDFLSAQGVSIEPVPTRGWSDPIVADPVDLSPVVGLGFVADFGGPAIFAEQDLPVGPELTAHLSTWTAAPSPGQELLVSAVEYPADIAAQLSYPDAVRGGLTSGLATMTDQPVDVQEILAGGQPAMTGAVLNDRSWARMVAFLWQGRLYQILALANSSDPAMHAEAEARLTRLLESLQLTE